MTDSAPYPGSAPAGALFDGRALIAEADEDYLVSEVWRFVPPLPARDNLAEVGQLTVTATQGQLHTSTTQVLSPFDFRREPGQMILEWDEGSVKEAPHALSIWGFEVGSRIPIGIYRALDSQDEAERDFKLIKQIGHVTIPNSGLAVFNIPPSVLSEFGTGNREYCIAGPFQNVHLCFI